LERFYAEEIVELAEVLQIPDPFITKGRYRFSSIEALGILLARYKSAGAINDLVIMYDRPESAISEVVNELSTWLYEQWDHLLGFDVDGLLAPEKLESYADAIYKAGAPSSSVWAFLDCTIRSNCRPSWYQRQGYSGYKKTHALKYQALKLPNGMFGHVFGPEPGRHNDNYLLSKSGLLEWCRTHAVRRGTDDRTPPAERYLQVFGDPAYGIGLSIMSPFAGAGERTEAQMEWNEAMASVRIEVEHGFGGVVRLWQFLNAWWKHQIYSSPIGIYYRVGCLLTNAHNCLRPNQTAQYFDCEPPTLDEYFHK
jgi:hypothetical protein